MMVRKMCCFLVERKTSAIQTMQIYSVFRSSAMTFRSWKILWQFLCQLEVQSNFWNPREYLKFSIHLQALPFGPKVGIEGSPHHGTQIPVVEGLEGLEANPGLRDWCIILTGVLIVCKNVMVIKKRGTYHEISILTIAVLGLWFSEKLTEPLAFLAPATRMPLKEKRLDNNP